MCRLFSVLLMDGQTTPNPRGHVSVYGEKWGKPLEQTFDSFNNAYGIPYEFWF